MRLHAFITEANTMASLLFWMPCSLPQAQARRGKLLPGHSGPWSLVWARRRSFMWEGLVQAERAVFEPGLGKMMLGPCVGPGLSLKACFQHMEICGVILSRKEMAPFSIRATPVTALT